MTTEIAFFVVFFQLRLRNFKSANTTIFTMISLRLKSSQILLQLLFKNCFPFLALFRSAAAFWRLIGLGQSLNGVLRNRLNAPLMFVQVEKCHKRFSSERLPAESFVTKTVCSIQDNFIGSVSPKLSNLTSGCRSTKPRKFS